MYRIRLAKSSKTRLSRKRVSSWRSWLFVTTLMIQWPGYKLLFVQKAKLISSKIISQIILSRLYRLLEQNILRRPTQSCFIGSNWQKTNIRYYLKSNLYLQYTELSTKKLMSTGCLRMGFPYHKWINKIPITFRPGAHLQFSVAQLFGYTFVSYELLWICVHMYPNYSVQQLKKNMFLKLCNCA